MDLNLELEIAAAAAQAARARAEASSNERPGATGFAARGAIDMLMSPIDLLTFPVRGVQRLLGQEVDAPSTMVADLASGLGLNLPPEGMAAESRGERIGEMTGGAIGMLIPGAGLVGGMRAAGGPVARGIAETVRAPFVRNPAGALAAETAAGAGAGYLGYEAEQAAEDTAIPPELARFGGELAGGLGGAGLPAAVGAAGRGASALMDMIPGVSTVRRVGSQLINPSRAAFERASESLRGRLSGTPEEAIDALYSDTILDLTSAQRINQPRVLQLEQDILLRDPVLDAQYRDRRAAAQAQVADELGAMGEGGTVRDTARAMDEWVQTSRQALEQTVDDAAQAAEQAALRAGPRSAEGPADLSAAFREQLEGSYRRVRAEESALWDDVPDNVMGGTSASVQAYFDAARKATDVRAGQIPADARRFLDPESPDFFGGSVSAVRMRALMSTLREEARVARSQGQAFTAMMADDLADAVARDLDAIPGVGGPLDAARSFSRVFNEVYRQGPVGEVLGTARVGGERVSPEETLSRLLGGQGERLVARASATEAAVGPAAPPGGASPQAQTLASDYLRRQFSDVLTPETGDMRLGPAERWVAGRRETLDRYPALASLFDAALAAGRSAQEARKTVEGELAALSRSPAQRLVDAPVHREFQTILNTAQNPAAEFSELMAIARQAGPEAVDGLRSAATSFLLNGARARRAGALVLEGGRLNQALADPRTMDAMSNVFEPEQLARIQRLADELSVFEASQAARGGDAARLIEPDAVDTILQLVARVAGASAARTVTPPGGATIQNPQIGSQFMRNLARRLTTDDAEQLLVDAVTKDRALFEALLTGRQNQQQFDRAAEIVNLWAQSNVSRTTMDIDDAMQDFEDALMVPRQPLRLDVPPP
jgi:hypothetical protein